MAEEPLDLEQYKYYVTYVRMGAEAGANPLGHASLLLSCQKEEEADNVVENCFGFYSQPSTSKNWFVKLIKKIFHIDADLQNGHGALRQEEMRYLNANGLFGISFEASKEQYESLKNDCLDRLQNEPEVIEALNAELLSQNLPANGQTRFKLEKEKARQENREPRLERFHLALTFNHGFDSSNSFTCKSMAIKLLHKHGIISDEIRDQLLVSKANAAFPAFSALPLRPLRLVSTGPREMYRSQRTSKVFYNHVWGKNALFWASPTYTPDNVKEYRLGGSKKFKLIKKQLDRIFKTETELYQMRDRTIKKQGEQHPTIRELEFHLEEVQKLPLLFQNASKNQDSNILRRNLLASDQILNKGNLALMNAEEVNYSFLLKALTSPKLDNPLLGLLLLAVAIPTMIFIPVLGASLLAASISLTALQTYSFYKMDKQRTKFQRQELPQEPELIEDLPLSTLSAAG